MRHLPQRNFWLAAAVLASAAILAAPSPALADAIDGDWCDGNRRISVEGPNITTPGGNKIQGEYDRHDARFVLPAGEPSAGAKVEMVLQGEEHAEVAFGSEPKRVWRRCKNTS